ncbi:uncharacterized protein RB166_014456 isoform 1-T2 [Leptodactylus fuscus]|uniref:uncharacterized protein LOC142213204 n=1 Tax=Leptodactylus fuscus TaxID=238119 RepID=UPI003F4F16F8
MPGCVVRGCGFRWKKGDASVTLHCFPKEPERIKHWLQQSGQYGADIDQMVEKVYLGKVYDTYRICSLHFTHDCYHYDGHRRTLRKDAVPTIFDSIKPSAVSTDISPVSWPSSSSSGQRIPSALPAESQNLPFSDVVHTYCIKNPAGHPKISSQSTLQQTSLVPQHVDSSAALQKADLTLDTPSRQEAIPVSPKTPSTTSSTSSSVTQQAPPTSVVHIPLTVPTSQAAIPNSQPTSKKRKLEEKTASSRPTTAPSSSPSVVSNHCVSQTSANTNKAIFLASSTSLVKPMGLRPLMVDKGVNTDFITNRRSCCISTDPYQRTRNMQTQTKIATKHRKTMCTLLVPSKRTKNSRGTVSTGNPEDGGFTDCSSSGSSDDDNDPGYDLESFNLNLVKVEYFPDSEVDVSAPTSTDIGQVISIKKENEDVLFPAASRGSFTTPDVNSKLKMETNIKTEEDQCPISTPSQNIIDFVSQHISFIPNKPVSPVCGNPTSWETSAMQTDEEPEDPSDFSFHVNELSEDEDESFLVPSDGEDEDDVKQVFQDLDSPVENPVEEEKYIVFDSCLKKLIMMIPCMSKTKCTSPLTQYRKETIGSYLSIEVRCRSGHTSLLWESQPRHGYEPLGNVLLSAAVLCSGSSFVKSQHMFKLLNVKSIDKASYYRHQSMYLYPAIRHHWREEQKAVIRSVQERPLCLAGDRQLDNPGFSAKYSIYSLMDVASKKICSLSVEPVTPQVTLEGLEKVGFQKAMGELQTMNAKVKMVVTDRSIAIQEILKDEYPGIAHKFDLWHLSKSIGNEVLMAAKHKDCEILYQWVEAIKNHIWWSSCTCCNNPDLLIQKWKSVIQHVANVHRWDSDSDCKACHHPPLPKEVVNNTNWLEEGSVAHEELKKIVENTNLLKDIKELSFLCHAGELEIYRTTCLKYRPKSLHFFMDSMVARTQLAALDHNRNVHRVKEVVKNAGDTLSDMTQSFKASKGQKSWIIKTLYEPGCQNFLFDIMNDVIALVKEEKTFQ